MQGVRRPLAQSQEATWGTDAVQKNLLHGGAKLQSSGILAGRHVEKVVTCNSNDGEPGSPGGVGVANAEQWHIGNRTRCGLGKGVGYSCGTQHKRLPRDRARVLDAVFEEVLNGAR